MTDPTEPTPPPDPDPLARLGEQIRATRAAAGRLREGTPPPQGWASPPPSGPAASSETEALAGLLELARGLLPHELVHQLTELVQELLLVVRALIDWYLEGRGVAAPGRREAPAEVQDIPLS